MIANQAAKLVLVSLFGNQFDPAITGVALGTDNIGLSHFANMGGCSKRTTAY
jgi:hypothetical protein